MPTSSGVSRRRLPSSSKSRSASPETPTTLLLVTHRAGRSRTRSRDRLTPDISSYRRIEASCDSDNCSSGWLSPSKALRPFRASPTVSYLLTEKGGGSMGPRRLAVRMSRLRN